MNLALERIRTATLGSEYEKRLFVVGGYVRDLLLGNDLSEVDLDLVFEGDIDKLLNFLCKKGIVEQYPIVYRRFGTAKLIVAEQTVEFVAARRESYVKNSRKPSAVQPASLLEDARRRDFTINTLLLNLHTGELIDSLGIGQSDLLAKILRTPLLAQKTFIDDPLRMLRAIRLAARLDFTIEAATWQELAAQAEQISKVSYERIRDEFLKILQHPSRLKGLKLLRRSGLLSEIAPELVNLPGESGISRLEMLSENASLTLLLSALLYTVPAEKVRTFLKRLRFPGSLIENVLKLMTGCSQIEKYTSTYSDGAVRQLIYEMGDVRAECFTLYLADSKGKKANLGRALLQRMLAIQKVQDVTKLESPLKGAQIMHILGIPPGKMVGELKKLLTEAVIEGKLMPEDSKGAVEFLREYFKKQRV